MFKVNTPIFVSLTGILRSDYLVNVDDIIITGTNPDGILRLQNSLHASFHMKNLGPFTYFLGLEVHKLTQGLFINQQKYIQDLIQQARLQNTSPIDSPLELNAKYSKEDGEPLSNPTTYRQLVSSLVSQFMHEPIHAVKWIIRYLIGTLE